MDNTGAYSTFQRLRSKPLCAQNLKHKGGACQCFPRILSFVMKPTRFTLIFRFFRESVFAQPPGSSECTSPEVTVTAPKVVGRAQLISVR